MMGLSADVERKCWALAIDIESDEDSFMSSIDRDTKDMVRLRSYVRCHDLL